MWLVEFGRSPAIVKQITVGSGADADARFAREVTALRPARRVRPAFVPDVLGTDPGGRLSSAMRDRMLRRGPVSGSFRSPTTIRCASTDWVRRAGRTLR